MIASWVNCYAMPCEIPAVPDGSWREPSVPQRLKPRLGRCVCGMAEAMPLRWGGGVGAAFGRRPAWLKPCLFVGARVDGTRRVGGANVGEAEGGGNPRLRGETWGTRRERVGEAEGGGGGGWRGAHVTGRDVGHPACGQSERREGGKEGRECCSGQVALCLEDGGW